MKENQNLEWKESWHDEYLKWICGFANAEGGVLLIGRNDKGVDVGVANAKKLLEDLPNKIRDVLGIMADIRLVRRKDKDLIEIRVDSYPGAISYKGEYYYRSGSTKQELKGAALDRFLMRKYGRTWDGAPLPHVSLRSLSKSAVSLFKKLARESQRLESGLLREPLGALVEKLNLVEGTYLKRAAILLFNADPDRFFPGAFVKIGYFRAEADLVYHDEIHGDLFTQSQQTVELLLTKYLKAAISYQGIQRVETYPVPREALREAVLNALIHRDYAITAPIQIRVYDDHLSIWNPGLLPEGWTAKKLLSNHASCPYNPLVANAFFRAGEIEAWGRGIKRIVETCREAGSPAPIITYEPHDLWMEFPYSPDYLSKISKGNASSTVKGRDEASVKTSVKASGKTPQKTPRKTPQKTPQKTFGKILELLSSNSTLSIQEIALLLSKSESAVKRAIRKLRDNNRLRRIGQDKGGHWEVLP
jgi:ATP-dependent DNA helicase RecG